MNLVLTNSSDYRNMLTDIAEVAILAVRREEGLNKKIISIRRAYDMYGRATVDAWLEQGLISKRTIIAKRKTITGLDSLELDITYRSLTLGKKLNQ